LWQVFMINRVFRMQL